MAHIALLDKDNKVLQVIRVDDKELLDNGIEVEQKGIDWLFNEFKINQQRQFLVVVDAKQTFFDASYRNKYASIGDTYNSELDVFISPQPYPSWSLNGANWEAPTPKPEGDYYWNEEQLEWVES